MSAISFHPVQQTDLDLLQRINSPVARHFETQRFSNDPTPINADESKELIFVLSRPAAEVRDDLRLGRKAFRWRVRREIQLPDAEVNALVQQAAEMLVSYVQGTLKQLAKTPNHAES